MGVKKVAFNNVSTTTKMLPLLIDTLGIEKLDHQNVLKTGKILGYNTEIGVDEKSSNKNSIEFWVDGISNAETHLKHISASYIYLYDRAMQAGLLDDPDELMDFLNETIH